MSRVERWLLALLLVLGLFVRWRIREGWTFVGSDSYGYVRLADELRVHHRFALGPADPPHFGRMPGYPLFVALSKGGAMAEMSGGAGWGRISLAQALFDALVGLPLIFWIARRVGGTRAGLVALGLAAICPFTLLYICAALTEAPATTLTVATVAAVLFAVGARRRRLWFALAGGCVALSVYVRPDGILLAFAFVPALLALRADRRWRERVICGALALAAFLVVYAPWPIRNLVELHEPHWLGQHTDKDAHPLPNYHGYWAWMRTWGHDNRNQTSGATCFYNPPCQPNFSQYPPHAFDTSEDQKEVERLFKLRAREGVSPSVSEGFEALARKITAEHPLRVRVWLPLSRAFHMWIDRNDEPLQRRDLPWPAVTVRVRTILPKLSLILFALMVLAAITVVWLRRTRALALILLAPILARTFILPYALYSMPRYVNEVIPLALVLIAVAAVEGVRRLVKCLRVVVFRSVREG